MSLFGRPFPFSFEEDGFMDLQSVARGCRCHPASNEQKRARDIKRSVTRRKVAMIGLFSTFGFDFCCEKKVFAEEVGENSDLVRELLRKSAENKEKNDALRKDYSKQYESYLAIEFFGNPPKDLEVRKKYGVDKKPVECNLKFFQTSRLCSEYE